MGNSGNSGWLYFLGYQNHCRQWLQPWNKKKLTPWKKKVMTNLDSILQSRAMAFPVFKYVRELYGSESWTTKKAECRGIDAFELWCWRRLPRVPWTARRSNQSILKINPAISLEGMMLKLKLQYFGHLMRRVDSLEKTLMLGGIGAGEEGDDRGWDGWMASLTRWLWVWVNSRSWWWTGRPGVLRFMGSQRGGHNWATELKQRCSPNHKDKEMEKY